VAIVFDTGPLLAALDAAEPDHAACAALVTGTIEDRVIPLLVLAEVDYWCARRLTPDAWLTFLEDVVAGAYRVEPPDAGDLKRCRDLQTRYQDLSLGVVDASVIALLERLGETKVATLDHPVRRMWLAMPLSVSSAFSSSLHTRAGYQPRLSRRRIRASKTWPSGNCWPARYE
jgi:predicted nucleic acid-binding protein